MLQLRNDHAGKRYQRLETGRGWRYDCDLSVLRQSDDHRRQQCISDEEDLPSGNEEVLG